MYINKILSLYFNFTNALQILIVCFTLWLTEQQFYYLEVLSDLLGIEIAYLPKSLEIYKIILFI